MESFRGDQNHLYIHSKKCLNKKKEIPESSVTCANLLSELTSIKRKRKSSIHIFECIYNNYSTS